MLTVALCGIASSLLSHALHRITLGGKSAGFTLCKKQFLDFSLLSAGFWPYREWASLVSCLVFSTRAHTSLRTLGGAIPASKYRSSTMVGFRHLVTALHALFRSGFSSWHEMISSRLVLRTQPQNSIMSMLLFLWYLRLLPIPIWDNFLSRLLRVATFIFVLCMCSL